TSGSARNRPSCKRSRWSRTRPTTSSTICSRARSGPDTRWAARSWAAVRRSPGTTVRRRSATSPRSTCRAGSSSRSRATSPTIASWSSSTRASRASIEALPIAQRPPVLKPGVNIVNKTLEQVHVIMGFPGLHHSAPERYALFLLNDIIGGSMSSRLFQEVREREGLVYAIHSGVQAYTDTGVVYVYAATDEKNFSKVLKSTLKVLRELKKTGVTEEELRRAKDHLKGSLMLSLESTSGRMNRLAKHEMHHGTFLS